MESRAIVTFLNVGWGDAHLIRLPSGTVTLIDGGDGGSADGERDHPLAWMDRHGVDRLDWMILTHIHEDHLNGLLDVARRREVRRAVLPYELPALSPDDPASWPPELLSPQASRVLGMLAAYSELLRLLKEQGTEIRWRADYAEEERAEIWREDGYALTHLYPWQGDPEPGLGTLRAVARALAEGEDAPKRMAAVEAFFPLSNDDSSVYRLAGSARSSGSVLLGGDQPIAGWRRIASRTDVRSHVWKVPHHGLEDAFAPEVLALVDPAVCVIPICLERSSPLLERWDRLRAESGAAFYVTGGIPPGERLRLTDGLIETRIGG